MSSLLSGEQTTTLEDILNNIIPANDEMPAAGLVVRDFVGRSASRSPVRKRIVLAMIAVTDAVARAYHDKSFSEVPDSLKEFVLKIVEEQNEELFSEFVNLAYDGYYTNPSVINLLGVDAGAPQPVGFSNSSFDPGIVDNVRMLGPRYRVI